VAGRGGVGEQSGAASSSLVQRYAKGGGLMLSKLGRKWKRNVKDRVRNFFLPAEENAEGKTKDCSGL